MTARDIQRRLCADLFQQSFVLPNYTPSNWFECDVFEVTAAGYFREYEIKISRHDFRNDAKKAKTRWTSGVVDGRWQMTSEKDARKHKLLEQRDPRGPVQFWFVVPRGLVKREEVPSWAGLIEAERVTWEGQTPAERARARINLFHDGQHVAPRLHSTKIESRIRTHANGTCYWRMHRMLLKNPNASMEASA